MPPTDTTPYSFETSGAELDAHLAALERALAATKSDLETHKDSDDAHNHDHDHDHPTPLTEADVIELIEKHAPDHDEPDDDDEPDPALQERLAAIDEELENIREAIGMVRGGITATIGPSVPDEGYFHSNPGWGMVMTIQGPRQLRECTVVSNQSGEFTAEVWEYNGDVGELVDSTTIEVISDGENTVDLDLQIPEPGTYLLTRDFEPFYREAQEMGGSWSEYMNHPDTEFSSSISLWRTTDDWDGWGEGDGALTLHFSAHPEFGGEPRYWYSFFDLEVLPYSPER